MMYMSSVFVFFFSSRRRHTRFDCDWSSDVCSSDLSVIRDNRGEGNVPLPGAVGQAERHVARACSVTTFFQHLGIDRADGVARPADLEGSDRLERLELEPDFPGTVIGKPNQRGPHRAVLDAGARLADGVERNTLGKRFSHSIVS